LLLWLSFGWPNDRTVDHDECFDHLDLVHPGVLDFVGTASYTQLFGGEVLQ